MEAFDLAEAAERSGVSVEELRHLCDLGILTPDEDGRFTTGVLRRAALVKGLADAGIPLDGPRRPPSATGKVSLDFLDAPAFERFAALGGDTFAETAERTGVPIELLQFVREVVGLPHPAPDRPGPRRRGALRRVARDGAPRWHPPERDPTADPRAGRRDAPHRRERVVDVADRGHRPGHASAACVPTRSSAADIGDRMSALSEQVVIGMYHLQQTRAWTGNIIEGVEAQLAAAGLHSRLEHPPAMCFLDITGYTRLTQEQGDAAAVELAEHLGEIVQRTAIRYGGRPIKWLGDGVMLHFPNPGSGVVAALEMVEGCVGGRAAAGACRPARRAGHLPGGRLLRPDRQPRLADRRLRAAGRGDRQPDRGRRRRATRRSRTAASARSS